MDEYERLAQLGRLYRLRKQASVLGAAAKVPGAILRTIDAGARGAGRAAYHAAGKGAKGRVAQAVVRTSPYTVGGGALMYGTGRPYMKAKHREFLARQHATRPHYDPYTQRFI